MDGTYDVPDATDWLNTPLSDFSTLENALHCQICKEFYDTPMITSCAHTFCSKCIRTSLSTDGKCPACRASEQASKLRNNWALQEVVKNFLDARPAALGVARREQEVAEQAKKRGKRKRTVLDSDDIAQAEQDGRTTRSKSRRLAASQSSQTETIEVEDSEGDEDFEPEELQNDGLVDCPLGCGKRMKIEAVDPHLDRCEDEQKQAGRAKSRTPVNTFSSSRPNSSQNIKPQERLPELNYSILNETKLRKKLDELGIPSWGAKSLLIKRHVEWVNLWNANCDSNRPRTKRELLHELDTWERTQGGKAPVVNGSATTIMRKDFDGASWANKNRDGFSKLVAEARARNKPTPDSDQNTDEEAVETADGPLREAEPQGNTALPSNTTDALVNSNPETIRPYENNTEAISSIREKVKAANSNEHIEPVMNAGFNRAPISSSNHTSTPTEHRLSPPAKASMHHPSFLEQNSIQKQLPNRRSNGDGHVIDGSTGLSFDLPAHQQAGPVKKMPMFAVPQAPVTDVDAAGGGGVAEE